MIGILCAMDKELQFFVDSIKNERKETYLNHDFIIGSINNHDVVISKCGIGKVEAGISAALMIEHYAPSLLINSGIAGGYDKSLKVFDVVCANKTGCYDVDFTAEGHELGSLNGENRFCSNDLRLNSNLNLNIKYGLILSADLFATDRNYLDNIFGKYFSNEKVLAVDMESGSIARICEQNNTPWCIIRAISDVVGMESQINSYWEFAKQAAYNAYLLIVENYLK